MTLRFPDVSSYQRGLRLEPGTVAVIAKATQGLHWTDDSFSDFMAQAAQIGALKSGYHFLEHGNAAAQAAHCHAVAGHVPMMIDCEPTGDSRPTVADCLEFIDAFHGAGGRVWACYFPRWYWNQVGGDLRPLGDHGVCLVSSDYSGYTDDPHGAGWQPYGGRTPAIWQTTDKQAYGGKLVDFNAFRGSVADLAALIQGDEMTPYDVWAFRGNNGDGHPGDQPDVHQSLLTTRDTAIDIKTELDGVKAELDGVKDLLQRVAAKVGA